MSFLSLGVKGSWPRLLALTPNYDGYWFKHEIACNTFSISTDPFRIPSRPRGCVHWGGLERVLGSEGVDPGHPQLYSSHTISISKIQDGEESLGQFKGVLTRRNPGGSPYKGWGGCEWASYPLSWPPWQPVWRPSHWSLPHVPHLVGSKTAGTVTDPDASCR